MSTFLHTYTYINIAAPKEKEQQNPTSIVVNFNDVFTFLLGGVTISIPIGSMYGIYANIYHQYNINIPQMLAYIPYMDPMGYKSTMVKTIRWPWPRFRHEVRASLTPWPLTRNTPRATSINDSNQSEAPFPVGTGGARVQWIRRAYSTNLVWDIIIFIIFFCHVIIYIHTYIYIEREREMQ